MAPKFERVKTTLEVVCGLFASGLYLHSLICEQVLSGVTSLVFLFLAGKLSRKQLSA